MLSDETYRNKHTPLPFYLSLKTSALHNMLSTWPKCRSHANREWRTESLQNSSGGRSTQILYLSKSNNTIISKHSITSKSPAFNILLYYQLNVLALWLIYYYKWHYYIVNTDHQCVSGILLLQLVDLCLVLTTLHCFIPEIFDYFTSLGLKQIFKWNLLRPSERGNVSLIELKQLVQ